MSPAPAPADHDVVILAGGLGTRLRGAIGELPKVLAPVAGRPFLDLLLARLADQGFRRIILLLGYRADAVQAHLAAYPPAPLVVETLIEPAPLGTAGALRTALPQLRSDPVMVMNGDSLVDFDATSFLDAFRSAGATAALLTVAVPDAGRYGALDLDSDGRIRRFREKAPDAGPGPINAGVYLLSQAFLARLAASDGPSFERDVLAVQPPGSLLAIPSPGGFIDIGTPESLGEAPDVLGLNRP